MIFSPFALMFLLLATFQLQPASSTRFTGSSIRQRAPRSCSRGSDCPSNQCCQMLSSIRRKRNVHQTLGTCASLGRRNRNCPIYRFGINVSGKTDDVVYMCNCRSHLTCVQRKRIIRRVPADIGKCRRPRRTGRRD